MSNFFHIHSKKTKEQFNQCVSNPQFTASENPSTIKAILLRVIKDIKTFWPGIVAFLIYYLCTIHFFGASCPMILLTGLPCPGCGLTRAFFSIFSLDFVKAFNLNPSVYGWLILFIYIFITRYIRGRKLKLVNVILISVCIFSLGWYIYSMVNFFPNKIPYVYTKKNLLYFISTLRK